MEFRIFKLCQILAVVYLFVLVFTVVADRVGERAPQDDSNLDKLIKEIFNIPTDQIPGGISDPPIHNEQPVQPYKPPVQPYQPTVQPHQPPVQPHQPTVQPHQPPVQPYQPPTHPPTPHQPEHHPITQSPVSTYDGSHQGPETHDDSNPCPIGECTSYFLCKNGSIITDGEGLLDVRFGEEDNPDPTFHPCKGLFQTCCHLKSDTPIVPVIEKKQGCGYRNDQGVGFRITGQRDSEAQYGEFPWMVAIIKEEPSLQDILNVYQCGGSLIHPQVVLTAAHCVYAKKVGQLKVRAGEWDTQTRDELFPHQDRIVNEIIIHENYYKGGLFNDIALLILQEPLELSEIINTVCLPPQNYNFDGSRCFASGWGKDSWGKEGKYQVILKKVDLPIIPRTPCVERLRRTRLGNHFNLHSSFICAGGERGKDTCKGDGGSPLVCPIPAKHEQYFQSGIVSWGIGCNELNPGVYVSVAKFRDWIDQQFQYKALDTSYYSI